MAAVGGGGGGVRRGRGEGEDGGKGTGRLVSRVLEGTEARVGESQPSIFSLQENLNRLFRDPVIL